MWRKPKFKILHEIQHILVNNFGAIGNNLTKVVHVVCHKAGLKVVVVVVCLCCSCQKLHLHINDLWLTKLPVPVLPCQMMTLKDSWLDQLIV